MKSDGAVESTLGYLAHIHSWRLFPMFWHTVPNPSLPPHLCPAILEALLRAAYTLPLLCSPVERLI